MMFTQKPSCFSCPWYFFHGFPIYLGKLSYFTNLNLAATTFISDPAARPMRPLNLAASYGDDFPIKTMIPGLGRTGFGRYNLPIYIYNNSYIYHKPYLSHKKKATKNANSPGGPLIDVFSHGIFRGISHRFSPPPTCAPPPEAETYLRCRRTAMATFWGFPWRCLPKKMCGDKRWKFMVNSWAIPFFYERWW